MNALFLNDINIYNHLPWLLKVIKRVEYDLIYSWAICTSSSMNVFFPLSSLYCLILTDR